MNNKYLYIIIDTLSVGGAETQIIRLLPKLLKYDWNVKIYTLLPKNEFNAYLKKNRIEHSSLNLKSIHALSNFIDLISVFKKHQARGDKLVVHSHIVTSNLVSRIFVLIISNLKLVNTVHNTNEGSELRYFAYRMSSRYVSYISAMCEAALKVHINKKASPKNKLHLVYNAIDTSIFKRDEDTRNDMRRELDLSDKFVWISVGNLVKQKNYINLLKAWKIVCKEYFNKSFKLVIVGDGNEKERLQAYVDKEKLNSSVSFLGKRHDVDKFLSVSDAFVMSSDWEGFPMVLLEASASELPVVATNVGGVSEIILDNETGFLCKSSSISLAHAMKKVMNLNDKDLRNMGLNGRNYVTHNFNIDKIADQWNCIYESLI